eukprot:jgi/Ulvmu1/326/UM001_0330.1
MPVPFGPGIKLDRQPLASRGCARASRRAFVRARRTADADAEAGEAPTSTDLVPSNGKSGDDKMVAARSSVDQVKAIAAKISAARRLARKLAEEKAAVSALTDGNSMEAELIKRKTQLNSAEAAAAAARADALARSSRLKASSRSREAARLAAENRALLEVLSQVAQGNPSIQQKLESIRQQYPGSRVVESSDSVDVAEAKQAEAPAKKTSEAAPAQPTASAAPPAPPKPTPAAPTPAPTPAKAAMNGATAAPAKPAEKAVPAKDTAKAPPSAPTKASAAPPTAPPQPEKKAPTAKAPAAKAAPTAKPPAKQAAPAPKTAVPAKEKEKEARPPIVNALGGLFGAFGDKDKDKDKSDAAAKAAKAANPAKPASTPKRAAATKATVAPAKPAAPAKSAPAKPAAPAAPATRPPGASPTVPPPPAKATPVTAKKDAEKAKAEGEAAQKAKAQADAAEKAKAAEKARAADEKAKADETAAAAVAEKAKEKEAADKAATKKAEAEAVREQQEFVAKVERAAERKDEERRAAEEAAEANKKLAAEVEELERKQREEAAAAAKMAAAAAADGAAKPASAEAAQAGAAEKKVEAEAKPQAEAVPEVEAEVVEEEKAPEAPPPPPPVQRPPLDQLIRENTAKGNIVFTDIDAKPGVELRILVDKSRTVFAHDDNEHHLQLKVGINKWEDIREVKLAKVTAVPDVQHVYEAWLAIPDDVFAVDFVVQDFRTSKTENNSGNDFQLRLVGAPSEEEVLDRRAREFEAAERDRVAQIAAAEAKIAEQVAEEQREAESDAMHAWWRGRRAELRQQASHIVDAEVSGNVDGCADAQEGVFKWVEGRPSPGKAATLVYNRDHSELRHKKDLVLHVGCNNWERQEKEVLTLKKMDDAGAERAGVSRGDWYSARIQAVPAHARRLDFVISDKDLQVWDNNHNRDFHTLVERDIDRKTLEEETYKRLLAESLDHDTESANSAARKAGERITLRAEAQRKRRAVQRKVLYTNPLVPVAGQEVDVYYNPDMTDLRGRPEVYMRGSWNRWTHPSAIPITKMDNAFSSGIGFLRARVAVPADALIGDFVFLDSANEHSGFYDNNNGLDYHVPVTGATGTLPPLRIAHISVEMAPIAKVGGMGDVVTALGRAVQEYGHEVEVIMPKYDCLKYDLIKDCHEVAAFHWSGAHIRVFHGLVEGLRTTFLEPDNGMFWVGCVYGRSDDAHRFAFFCGAALEYLKNHAKGGHADIVHCHDWPTAPVAFGDTGGSKPVFTIHNLNYGAELIGRAMGAAAVATTVSPTYSKEISGHPAVAPHLGKMFGVRNGVDVDIWDPSADPFLPVRFNADSFDAGKAAAKRQLRQRMNLSDTDAPIIGVVTRLTHQKGIHLIKHAAWRTLERGGQFVLLGSAPDPRVQADFDALAHDLQNQYNDRAKLCFAFDEPLSHLIYAGCDMLLVPSMFEPCGLTQMIAMRYGTVAIVRKTGGLADTVFDIDDDVDRAEAYGQEVNGFNFEGTDNGGLDYALNRAISTWYNDPAFFRQLAIACMRLDWSWYGPAQDYIELYYRAMKSY